MTKSIVKFSAMGLLAIAVAGIPTGLRAQNTATPPATPTTPTTPPPVKKARTSLPFHGKLKAVDATAKTISIGEETIQITSETKITKGGKPAMLGDAMVGDDVAGAYKKDAEGKLNATSLRIGPKPPTMPDMKTNAPAK